MLTYRYTKVNVLIGLPFDLALDGSGLPAARVLPAPAPDVSRIVLARDAGHGSSA